MKEPNFADMNPAAAKVIDEMMAEQGAKFSLEKINLANLKHRSGIHRTKLRRMKERDFEETKHASKGRKAATTLLRGYTSILDGLLSESVANSEVRLGRLRENGSPDGRTMERYIEGVLF